MLIHFIFWQNLKMKISHPRFLKIGNHENLRAEFPSCLEKKTVSEQSGVHASSNNLSQTVFLFPKVCNQCSQSALCFAVTFNWWWATYLESTLVSWISFVWFSGHFSSRRNTPIVASMVSSCCPWILFLVYNSVLWDGRYIECPEIPYSTHALWFAGVCLNLKGGIGWFNLLFLLWSVHHSKGSLNQ